MPESLHCSTCNKFISIPNSGTMRLLLNHQTGLPTVHKICIPSGLFLLGLLPLTGSAVWAGTRKGVVLANEEGGSGVTKVKESRHANLTETGESGQFTLNFLARAWRDRAARL